MRSGSHGEAYRKKYLAQRLYVWQFATHEMGGLEVSITAGNSGGGQRGAPIIDIWAFFRNRGLYKDRIYII